MIGATEPSPHGVDCDDEYAGKLNVTCLNLHHHYKRLYCNGMYMMRPHTEMTYMWLTLVEERLTKKKSSLKRHPSPVPGRCCTDGQNGEGYPFIWTELHGQVDYPLQLRYNDHVKSGFPWYYERVGYRGRTQDYEE